MSPHATTAELRVAYRSLARRLHPDALATDDRAASGPPSGRAERPRQDMAAVNEAWRVLSDPGRRARYDAGLRRAALAASHPSPGRPVHTGAVVEPDDDIDFVPAPAWKQRMPVWAMLSLVAMAMIFLGTAYAGSAGGPATSVPSVDGVLTVGSCARVASGGVAIEVGCVRQHDGVVAALIDYDGRCPPATAGYRRLDGGAGYACLRTG